MGVSIWDDHGDAQWVGCCNGWLNGTATMGWTPWDGPHGMAAMGWLPRVPPPAHLLQGRVLDGVGVVVVVDDLEVAHGRALPRPRKLHVQLGLARALRVHREVGRLAHLHTCVAPPAPMGPAPRRPDPQHPETPKPSAPQPPNPVPVPSPVRLRPGPSALTLLLSWHGSTLMRNGLLGISCGDRLGSGTRPGTGDRDMEHGQGWGGTATDEGHGQGHGKERVCGPGTRPGQRTPPGDTTRDRGHGQGT